MHGKIIVMQTGKIFCDSCVALQAMSGRITLDDRIAQNVTITHTVRREIDGVAS